MDKEHEQGVRRKANTANATCSMSSPGGSVVKNPPVVQETRGAGSTLGSDPLEEEMATHCSILAWEIPGTQESGGLQP